MTATRMGGGARPVAQKRKTPNLALRSTFAANMALAALAATTGVLSARLLRPAGEGELAAIQTWPFLLGTLAMLGLDSALVYFIARHPEKGRQFTSTAVLLGVLASLVIGAVAWFALPFVFRAQPPQVVSAAWVFLLIGGIFAVVGIRSSIVTGGPLVHCMELISHSTWPRLAIYASRFLVPGAPERHPSVSLVPSGKSRLRSALSHCRQPKPTRPAETRS